MRVAMSKADVGGLLKGEPAGERLSHEPWMMQLRIVGMPILPSPEGASAELGGRRFLSWRR